MRRFGLINCANICPLNSVVQSLYACGVLKIEEITSQPSGEILRADKIIALLPRYSSGTQNDACEVFMQLREAAQFPACDFNEMIELGCPCGHSRSATSKNCVMSVSARAGCCVAEYINDYFEKSAVSLCERCGTNQMTQSISMTTAPSVFVIHIKNILSVKVDEIDKFLTIAIYGVPNKYALTAVVLYSGNARSGHYTALVFITGRWFLISDASVLDYHADKIIGSNPYLLFYKKIEKTH